MRLFADTSALLKRYLDEPGREQVLDALEAAEALVVSDLLVVEAHSALARRHRTGDLADEDYEGLCEDLLEDLEDIECVPVSLEILTRAVGLVERHPLRALDALQLASALESNVDSFLCADRTLAAVAALEGGLVVIGPPPR